MKAIRMHAVGGPEVLSLDDVDVPTPPPGHVLIEVAAAGVTHGDIMKRRGDFGPVSLPAGLGTEVSGTVVARNAVDSVRDGARVAAWVEHGYAEYVVASADAVITLPDDIDLLSAAALPVRGMTAYQTLLAGGLQKGERVLVHAAAGGVGTLAIQLARLLGAGTVIGTAGGPSRVAYVSGLGADLAIDYSTPDWADQVLEATDGAGVDLALDSVGGETAAQTLTCLAPFGRMVCFGAASGEPAAFESTSLMDAGHTVTGYSLMRSLGDSTRTAQAVFDLLGHIDTGRLSIIVTGAYPLAEAATAHTAMSARELTGNTILLPQS